MDVRTPDKVEKGHIEGAVAYSPAELTEKGAKGKFPSVKSAPIIIYSDSQQDAVAAFKTIRGWGYKNAAILDGSLKTWQTAGITMTTGSAGKKIVYVPKPVPGSIAIKQFKAIAAALPANTLILDVRDEGETKEGAIKGALHIPTQDVPARLSEIPKDKKIVIHCKTGVRASMAYQTLKENGYNAQFLDAKIAFDPSGKLKVTPRG
ncbi:hypothetical protein KKI24_04605 [bacterium]|nr:hypothetical protein [bacterium]